MLIVQFQDFWSIPRIVEKGSSRVSRAWFVWTYTKRPSGKHIISSKPKFIGYILSAFTPPLRQWFSTNTNKQIDYNETHIRSSTALVAMFFLTCFNASTRGLCTSCTSRNYISANTSFKSKHTYNSYWVACLWVSAYEKIKGQGAITKALPCSGSGGSCPPSRRKGNKWSADFTYRGNNTNIHKNKQ